MRAAALQSLVRDGVTCHDMYVCILLVQLGAEEHGARAVGMFVHAQVVILHFPCCNWTVSRQSAKLSFPCTVECCDNFFPPMVFA